MTISFVSATNGSTNSTYAVDCGSANKRILLVNVTSSTQVSSLTWNGETLTKVTNAEGRVGTTGRFSSLWSCHPVGTGSQSLVITGAGTILLSTAMLYSGVSDSSPTNGNNHGTVGSGPFSVSLTASNGDWLVGGADNDQGITTVSTNTTLRGAGSSPACHADSNGVSSPSALTFTPAFSANVFAYGAVISPYVPTIPTSIDSSSSSDSVTTTLTRNRIFTEISVTSDTQKTGFGFGGQTKNNSIWTSQPKS